MSNSLEVIEPDQRVSETQALPGRQMTLSENNSSVTHFDNNDTTLLTSPVKSKQEVHNLPLYRPAKLRFF